jgi:small subunit ribosomal protein S6
MMYIVHPEVDEDGVTGINDQVGQWIGDQGGEVLKTDVWGRRKLAYAIRKQSEGTYVVLDMRMAGANLQELERNLKLHE